MKYPEEDLANDLYSDLNQRFADRTPGIEYAIQGVGVHWCCTVKQGDRFCSIECFSERDGSEYYVSFEQNSAVIAMGRTSSKLEVIHAVDDWVQGSELAVLYDKFPFVDRHKRGILGIRDDLVANFPELSKLVKIEQKLTEIGELWFERDDRRASVYFSDDKQEIINISFYADTTSMLFDIKTHDRKLLAEIIKRWVGDWALLSEIRTEFPSVEMSKLADFYERGNLIEGEFLGSWDRIERFYESPSMYQKLSHPMIELVKPIRKEGYDCKLRAGTSMWNLCLSRSRSYGNMGLYSLVFQVEYDNLEINGEQKKSQSLRVVYLDNGAIAEEFVEKEIALTDRIRSLLQKLSEQPIYL
jgi:hypothetical protein